MRAKKIKHDKITDELGNTVEIKIWSVPSTPDKPDGYKYSLVYIVNGQRVLGYDNAEGKGHHRHSGTLEEAYKFISLKKLSTDFIKDIKNYKRRFYEDKKS
jgi:Family of unknown function (DUF6516)